MMWSWYERCHIFVPALFVWAFIPFAVWYLNQPTIVPAAVGDGFPVPFYDITEQMPPVLRAYCYKIRTV